MAYGNIRPIPELFTDLIGQVTSLVRKEGQLARAEISEKATRALAGMGPLQHDVEGRGKSRPAPWCGIFRRHMQQVAGP